MGFMYLLTITRATFEQPIVFVKITDMQRRSCFCLPLLNVSAVNGYQMLFMIRTPKDQNSLGVPACNTAM